MKTDIINNEKEYQISLDGRLDTTTAQEFDNDIKDLYDIKDINIVIDLTNLVYISSSGLRSFIALLKSVKKNGGSLRITNMRNEIKEIFEMTGFNTLFIIE